MRSLLKLTALLLLCGHTVHADTPKSDALAPSKDGYIRVGYDDLTSYELNIPDDDASKAVKNASIINAQIPDQLKKLDGKKVVVAGYMLPLAFRKSKVSELLLMRTTQGCCFGVAPNINEVIVVKMKEGSEVEPMQDSYFWFYGTFKVGAIMEQGTLNGIYS